MKYGNRDNRSGGWGGEKEMHAATCSECGNSCQVPFFPNGRKPVFCQNCFRKDEHGPAPRSFAPRPYAPRPFGGRDDRRGGDRPSFRPAPRGPSSDDLAQVNAKLDHILRLLKEARGE